MSRGLSKNLSLASWKFFFSGSGMSFRTGRYFIEAALLGAVTGIVTAAFEWMIVYMDEAVGLVTNPWARFFLPALGACAGALLISRFARVEHARGAAVEVEEARDDASARRTEERDRSLVARASAQAYREDGGDRLHGNHGAGNVGILVERAHGRVRAARMFHAGEARNEQRTRAGAKCRKEEAHPRIRDEAHGLVHVHDHPLKGGRHESCNRAKQCRLEKIAARAE